MNKKEMLLSFAVLLVGLAVMFKPAYATPVGTLTPRHITVVATTEPIKVSSSTNSSISLVFAGAFSSLPTSGWSEGAVAYQQSNKTLYVATQTVVSALSWKAL